MMNDSAARIVLALAKSLRDSGVTADVVGTAVTDGLTADVTHRVATYANRLTVEAGNEKDFVMRQTFLPGMDDVPTVPPIGKRVARSESIRRSGVPAEGWDVIEAGGGWNGPPSDPSPMP